MNEQRSCSRKMKQSDRGINISHYSHKPAIQKRDSTAETGRLSKSAGTLGVCCA